MWFLSKHTYNNINLHLKTIKLKKITFLSRLPVKKNLLSGLQSQDQIILLCTAVTLLVKAKRLKIGSERNTYTTHKAENAGILPVKKLCLSALYIMQFSIQFPNADFCNRPQLDSWPLARRLWKYCYFSSREWVILTSCSLVINNKYLPGT